MIYNDLKNSLLILDEDLLNKVSEEMVEVETKVMYEKYLDTIRLAIIRHNSLLKGRTIMRAMRAPEEEKILEYWVNVCVIKSSSNPNQPLHEGCGSQYRDFKQIELTFSARDLEQYVRYNVYDEYKKSIDLLKSVVQKHNNVIMSGSISDIQDLEEKTLEFWIRKGCIDIKKMSVDHISDLSNPSCSVAESEYPTELGANVNETKFFDDI